MDELDNTLRDISAIRSMMERATKFLSLSGLSGVSAGIIALAGAWVAGRAIGESAEGPSLERFLIGDALCVLIAALACSTFFSVKLAKKKSLPLWGPTTMFLLGALFLPLAAGGAFCGILLYHGVYGLLPAGMLVFYGLALLNAGNFTFSEVRFLGMLEILLGLTAGFRPALGLLFWAAGFGLLHIVYGILLYAKYEK